MKMRMHVPWKGGIICNKMKKKNTTLSEQFQNQISKS